MRVHGITDRMAFRHWVTAYGAKKDDYFTQEFRAENTVLAHMVLLSRALPGVFLMGQWDIADLQAHISTLPAETVDFDVFEHRNRPQDLAEYLKVLLSFM